MARTFEITNHAAMRMKERGMLHPSEMGLKIAGRKIKKQIREKCPKEGYKATHIYWIQEIEKQTYVYVTKQKDVSCYIVITCFKF